MHLISRDYRYPMDQEFAAVLMPAAGRPGALPKMMTRRPDMIAATAYQAGHSGILPDGSMLLTLNFKPRYWQVDIFIPPQLDNFRPPLASALKRRVALNSIA